MPLHLLTAGSDPNGTLFGIDTDGILRWYQHTGNGESNVAAGLAPWLRGFAANSGNPIGIGWGGFRWIGAGVQGILLGIDGNGVLHRYYYTGNGERDDGGDQNWAPQSGTPMMTFSKDWVQFGVAFSRSLQGPQGEDIAVVAVNSVGELWLFIFHNGVARPNSPMMLASGWNNYDVFSAGGALFPVDPAGTMYEFAVALAFNDDLTFTARLAGGNAIGKGWNDFTLVCGSEFDDYMAFYAVDSGHNLRWFSYEGVGASDPDGVTYWGQYSNTIISGSW